MLYVLNAGGYIPPLRAAAFRRAEGGIAGGIRGIWSLNNAAASRDISIAVVNSVLGKW